VAGDHNEVNVELTLSIAAPIVVAPTTNDADDSEQLTQAAAPRQALPAAAFAPTLARGLGGGHLIPEESQPLENRSDSAFKVLMDSSFRHDDRTYHLGPKDEEASSISAIRLKLDWSTEYQALFDAQMQTEESDVHASVELFSLGVLDFTRDAQSDDLSEGDITLKTITYTTTGFTLGAVLWMLRSGSLLTSLLLASPAWRNVDPLPVLERENDIDEDDAEDDDNPMPDPADTGLFNDALRLDRRPSPH
jgi:hypothetical protein